MLRNKIKRWLHRCKHDWSTPTGIEWFNNKERRFRQCKKDDCWKIEYITGWTKWKSNKELIKLN